jgi:tRNA modification GTPase
MQEDELQKIADDMRSRSIKYILIGNKMDDGDAATFKAIKDVLFISAKQQLNIDKLKQSLTQLVTGGTLLNEATIVTNARHYEALRALSGSLKDIQQAMQDNVPGDLLAIDIRRCLHFISEITGDISNEDILDLIFSKFCIGK